MWYPYWQINHIQCIQTPIVQLDAIGSTSVPASLNIYVRDLNSHSTEWGYTAENEDVELLSNWAATNHFRLIYDVKQGAHLNPEDGARKYFRI